MKLHELKQKRNTIATDMRALNEKIGDNAWTEEQRTEWNKAKSELEALDERIAREEELRRQDQAYIESNEEEQRQNLDPENNPQQDEKRAQVFDKWMRHGASEGETVHDDRTTDPAVLWRGNGVSLPDESG